MVVVVGADEELVARALEAAGPDGDVVVLDPSPERLERLRSAVRDSRVWFLIGDAQAIPLPDGSVDSVLGAEALPELARVRR